MKRSLLGSFVLSLLVAAPAWSQTIGVLGDHFTVDRGSGPQPKFLLFISYFDAMRAAHLEEDLDYIAQTLKFDGIRIFPNWWADFTDSSGCPAHGTDTLLDSNGGVRGDTSPPSGRLQRLIYIIEAAAARGLIVDVTFARETVEGLTVTEYMAGVTRVATILRPYRNVIFDLQNEATDSDPNQYLSATQIKELRDRILANPDPAQGDPNRVLSASVDVAPADAVSLAQAAQLPFLAYHDPRVGDWYAQVSGVVGTLRGANRPVHLQEPQAWVSGLTLCGGPESGDTNPAHFRTAMQNAKQAGAAGWTFHTRQGFMLASGSSFKARIQANAAERELLEGNAATGVQPLAGVAGTTTWPVTVTLTIDLIGTGSGTVATTTGQVCSGSSGVTCTATLSPGTLVTLTAAPSNGSFLGWAGACTGTTACTITVSADALVAANFSPAPQIAPQYYHLDALGSVRAVTDQSGSVLRTHDYFPFGEEYLAQAGNETIRFSTKERDGETGLDYFGARYYASRTGRFMTVDPIVDIETALTDPQNWNRYSYVGNRPTRLIDPDGRQWQSLVKYLGTYEQQLMKPAQAAMTLKQISDIAGVFSNLLLGGSVSDKIDANLRSPELGTQMEGVIGAILQNKFGGALVDVNQTVLDSAAKRLTEADIVLNFATVEVKTGTHPVDLNQLRRLQDLGLPVVVYAPQASAAQIRQLEAAGASVATDSSSLIRILQGIQR